MRNLKLVKLSTLTVSLFLLTVAVLNAEDPQMHSASTAAPGSVLQISVSGDDLENLTVSLVDDRDRTLSSASGFLWRSPTGRTLRVLLLGIPSTADSGNYTLVLNADQGRASWRSEQPLRLSDSDYPERIITLSGKMDRLYSDDSERKKQESQRLWSVLTSFNPEADFHIGPFIEPFPDGVPTAGFGDRRRYRMPDGTESSSVHFGSDFWAEKGTPIRAAGRGRVVLATERFLTGNTVVLEHLPGVFTLYYHMDRIDVAEGQVVEQGRVIGAVGDTGFATGEHLHWEMRVGATPVDVLEFLERPLLDTNQLMSTM